MRYDIATGVKRIKTKFDFTKSLMGLVALALPAVMFLSTGGAHAASSFFNGFETDTNGWFTNGGTITRVPSGTNGISSATGSFHAEVTVPTDFGGVFTRWGGYEGTFPANGYVTQVDVYVNMAENPAIGTDKRFDFSSAINTTNPNVHRRDFIFHLGTDITTAGQWKASVSNNAPGFPANPLRSPITIDETGWYTLESTFRDNGSSVLAVDMDVIKKSNSSVVGSWTLSDPTDIIGVTVGGNRYGWFVTSDFSFLAIDNSRKFSVNTPSSKDECKKGGWQNLTDENGQPFKNQGDCVSWTNHN